MMDNANTVQIILFVGLYLIFYLVGAMVDIFTSWSYFPPKKDYPPRWLRDTIPFWWLVVYTGALPILIAFVASGFNTFFIKLWVILALLGSVGWDLVFSKLWSGKWISDSCITGFWLKWKSRHINIGFSKETIGWVHLARVLMALVCWWILL